MNRYEVAVLYDPGLEVDLDGAEKRFKKIIDDNGGKIISSDNWGRRKLAYKIAGNDSGIYVFYAVEMEPASLKPLEASLNISDEIIRFLITKPDLKKQAKAEAEREAKAKKNAESQSASDSEEE